MRKSDVAWWYTKIGCADDAPSRVTGDRFHFQSNSEDFVC